MKKITLACLARDKQVAVEKLQQLGTLHISSRAIASSSADMEQLKKLQARLNKVLAAIRQLPKDVAAVECPKMEPAVALDYSLEIVEQIEQNKSTVDECRKSIALLEPWGSFSNEMIRDFAQKNLHIMLCTAAKGHLPEMPEGAVAKVISIQRGTTYYAVFSKEPIDDAKLTPAQLPEQTDMKYLTGKEIEASRLLREQQEKLAGFVAANSESLTQQERKLAEMSEFIQTRDGMQGEGLLAFLEGYIPVSQVANLHQAAQENLWVVKDTDVADDDDNVPTNLIIPKPFRMAKHIFDFVGILPGYRETDVSVAMLIFLSLFCGMLVGDAGYGLIFTCVVLYFRRKVKTQNAKDGMNLLLVMSAAILIFGALSGNWFAIPADKMPCPFSGLPWLSKGENAQKHVQLLCFFIAAFHMSMAALWRAIQEACKVNLKEDDTGRFLSCMRNALGQVGWGIFLWANFGLAKLLIVDGGSIGDLATPYVWLYGFGFAFILLFNINWKDMGTVIYMPFSFINSFVDVLSYIRLFAVGLSSVYIANSFNGMAMSISADCKWLIPVSLLILALGHLLNIALACMGVLVHGIRLNTLEFSGRMDLSWSGKPYKPFGKK